MNFKMVGLSHEFSVCGLVLLVELPCDQ